MWIHIPCTESHSARAWEGLSSDCDLPSETATAASLTSKGKHLQPASLQRAWRMEPWMRRLSGLTFTPSRANSLAIEWLSSLPGFLVNHTVSQESARASMMSDGYGRQSQVPYATFDRSTSSWKMCQVSLPLGDLNQSSVIWSPSGSIVNGTYSARRKRVPRTAGNGGSVWATPTVQDGKNTAGPSQFDRNSHPPNVEAVLWPTPNTSNGTGPGRHGTGGDNLQTVASIHQPGTTTPDGLASPKVLNPRSLANSILYSLKV